MLHKILNPNDRFFTLLRDDPVRPSIPVEKRVGEGRDVFVKTINSDQAGAIVCVSYQLEIPTSEDELFTKSDEPQVAIFYTIWSYEPGAARQLIFQAKDWIEENVQSVKRFITLSPPTDMARKFHLRNGAEVYRTNPSTINFEYR
jgi:hypothetical protein